jgi:hypothetical protein
MRLGRRTVDDLCVGCIRLDQGLEQPLPQTASRPSIEAIVDRRRWSVDFRAVLPSATDLQDVHDATDHPTIVDTTRPGLIARQ